MGNMIWKFLAGAIVLMVAFVIVMATLRGRDSRYYLLLSQWVTPISERMLKPSAAPLPLPFRPRLADEVLAKDWQRFQPELVDASPAGASVAMTPLSESVWWKNQRGPMFYRYLQGDADITLAVRTRKRSDDTVPPDMEWQFGGVILRDPAGDAFMSRENYVFSVVGHRGRRLQLETKSTVEGHSQVDAWDWDSGDAELRIERRGNTFTMSARARSGDPWRQLTQYERADLPQLLQLGLIVYAHSEGRGRHDLRVHFDQLSVAP